MTLGLIPQLANTGALRYFYEVAESGSFREAGERINIAASAINRQIKNLEQELGVELFERARGRGGVKLTPAGEVLMHRVRRAMTELATASQELGALDRLEHGKLTMGVNPAMAPRLVPPLIRHFGQTHPHVAIDVVVENTPRLIKLLLEDRLDFAAGYNIPVRPGVLIERAVPLRLHVMLRRDHPLAARQMLAPADLHGQPMIMPSAELMIRHSLDDVLRQAGLPTTPRITTNSFDLMETLAEDGQGICIRVAIGSAAISARPALTSVPLQADGMRPTVAGCCIRAGRSISTLTRHAVQQVALALDVWDNGDIV